MVASLRWFNASLGQIDGLARAALAHLWFEAIPRLKTATAASAAPWRPAALRPAPVRRPR